MDEKMTYEEALNEIIDAITDVEEHGDAIEFLQNYSGERNGEEDSEWKTKYEKLADEYKKRFKDRSGKSSTNSGTKKEDEEDEKITVEDLDFSGKTE